MIDACAGYSEPKQSCPFIIIYLVIVTACGAHYNKVDNRIDINGNLDVKGHHQIPHIKQCASDTSCTAMRAKF